MAYQAIYRKWRPLVFEDIVGQQHITTTLKNQITSGHIAHAYLFCGTRGTGKTTAAKVFARAVNCINNTSGSPCNECEMCRGILDGSIMDVTEIDAASNNGVDNIREIREEVNYAAARAKYKVYIIDEVHMLSGGAFNALLKTLEEPPEHVIFILATTEAHKVPQTILSRCQRFDFKRIRPADIMIRMKEIAASDGLDITEGAYSLLARLADGSMRDGLSILERCVSSCGSTLTEDNINSVLGLSSGRLISDITDCIIKKDINGILSAIDTLISDGKDINSFADSLIKYLRDLLICKVSTDPSEVLDYSEDDIRSMKFQSDKMTFEKISHAASVISQARSDAKWIKSPRVIYELALIKLTQPELDNSSEALLDRVSELEEKVRNGITVVQSEQKETPPPEKPKKEKKPVSEKLYTPIPQSAINGTNPIVQAAKKWDRYSAAVVKRLPHVAAALTNRRITVDGEGIIMLFERSEAMSKNIAQSFIKAIQSEYSKNAGINIVFKTAFTDEIEDYIIDIYSIADAPAQTDKTDSVSKPKDPLDELSERFPDLVEFTDDSEFINYTNTDFSQSELNSEENSSDDNDDSEEFLDENEIKQENGGTQ